MKEFASIVSIALITILILHVIDRVEIVNDSTLKSYVDSFNKTDNELYKQHIPNSKAYEFLNENIPLVDLPNKELEETYYFRWWTFRKHIKSTQDGFVITEFLPNVSWSKKHNTINCPAGHHILSLIHI